MRGILSILGCIIYKCGVFKRLCISEYLTKKVNAKGNGKIKGDTVCSYAENIYIGENSFVNGGQLIAGPNSKIVIGNDVMISYGVHIRTTYHNYKDRVVPMWQQGMDEADVIIEDNCWIGYNAQIMSGVIVHSGAVVAANAVVTKDVPSNVVVGGVPAKEIIRLGE